MRLYLDDDSAARALITILRRAGHDVQIPADVGMAGEEDPVHFLHAIRQSRVLLSGNHDDLEDLHELVVHSGGSHPGVFILRKDGNPNKDMKVPQVARAISNVLAAALPLQDALIVLNHWR